LFFSGQLKGVAENGHPFGSWRCGVGYFAGTASAVGSGATGAFGGAFFGGSSFASRSASVIAIHASRQCPAVAVERFAFMASSSLVMPHPSAMASPRMVAEGRGGWQRGGEKSASDGFDPCSQANPAIKKAERE